MKDDQSPNRVFYSSTVVDDLTGFRASQTQFDVVMVFFFLNRGIFGEIVKAIRPGALLLYKTNTLEQLKLPGGPKDPLHLLEPGELLGLAGGLQVLHYREALGEKATAEDLRGGNRSSDLRGLSSRDRRAFPVIGK